MRPKILNLFLILLMGILTILPTQAQSKKEKERQKKEEKKWKARKKKMMEKPLKFKDMTEGIEALPAENEGLQAQLDNIKETLTYRNKQNKALQEELDKLLEDPNAGISENADNPEEKADDYKKGRIFKVQVSYMAKDVDVSSGNSQMVAREIVDGKYKYTLGYFRDYWEAKNFKNHLRSMGLKDAWIVSYVDNVRKDITEALTEEEIQRLREETGN